MTKSPDKLLASLRKKLEAGLDCLTDDREKAQSLLEEVKAAEAKDHDAIAALDATEAFWAKYHELAGNLAREAQEYESAAHHYREMIRYEEEGNEPLRGIGNSYGKLADILGKLGQTEDAIDAFQKSLRMMEEGGSEPKYRATISFQYATMLQDAERLDEAIAQWRATLALTADDSSPYVSAFTLRRLAIALRQNEQSEEAKTTLLQAVSLLEQDPNAELSMRCWRDLSEIYLDAQEISEALDAITKALDASQSVYGAKDEQIEIMELFARACLQVGRFQDAIVYYVRAHNARTRFEKSSISLLPSLVGLNVAYQAIERYDMATKVLRDIITLLQNNDASEHIATYQKQRDELQHKTSNIEIVSFRLNP